MSTKFINLYALMMLRSCRYGVPIRNGNGSGLSAHINHVHFQFNWFQESELLAFPLLPLTIIPYKHNPWV